MKFWWCHSIQHQKLHRKIRFLKTADKNIELLSLIPQWIRRPNFLFCNKIFSKFHRIVVLLTISNLFIFNYFLHLFCRVAPKLNPIPVLSIVRIQNFVVWINFIAFTKPGYVTETRIARTVRMNPYKFVERNRNAARINLFAITEHVFLDICNVLAKRNVLTDRMKKCAVSIIIKK